MRLLCWLFVFLIPFSGLSAQETDGAEPAAEIFPLCLVIEAVTGGAAETGGTEPLYGESRENAASLPYTWRPDWPVEIPPDAFTIRSGEISGITISIDGSSLILAFDAEGRAEKFPYFLKGAMAQLTVSYNEASQISEMTIEIPAAEKIWNLEFREYWDSRPALVRAFNGDEWFFIAVSGGTSEIVETWYDEDGNFMGAYSFALSEAGRSARIKTVTGFSASADSVETAFVYDSWGFISEISGGTGFYRVLYYREDLPRYWERRPLNPGEENTVPDNFALEWDESGFLVRVTGGGTDNRYEYTTDEKGNWIECRETRMTNIFGLLVPSQGTTFTRVLEYVNYQ